MIGRALFGLAFDAALAFGLATLMVMAVLRLSRRLDGAWTLALLSLPFVKALVELLRGIPDGAFFWAFEHGSRQDLGQFQVGFGLAPWGVRVIAALSARVGDASYPTSMGELIGRGAVLHGVGWAVEGLGVVAATGALGLVVRRAVSAWRFESRRRQRRQGARGLRAVRVDWRTVDVYEDEGAEGSPFAGGLLAPYIVVPARVNAHVPGAELEAILAHELAHVRRFDVVWTCLLAFAGDVLWFCPAVRWLQRRFADGIERAADRAAVRAGTRAPLLASAIVRVAALQRGAQVAGFVMGIGIASKARILELMADRTPKGSTGRHWLGVAMRLAILAISFNTVLVAVLFGNHG